MDAHVTEYSAADKRKALFAIFVAAFAAGLAIGAVMPMIAMSMELRGMAASEIGYVVAAAPVGLIVMGPFIGHLVNRLGLLGTMLLGGSIVVCSLLIMPSIFGALPWVITRFVAGLGVATIWILSETWVNALVSDEERGRAIAGFMITMTIGFGMGPPAVNYIGVENWTAFYLAAGVLAVALMPLALARNVAPQLPKPEGWSFGTAVRAAPGLMIIALFAGVTDATQISFYPVYAVREGFTTETALYMLTAIVIGSLVVQFPLGFIADKIGRNALLWSLLVLTVISGGLIPFSLHNTYAIWPLLVLWGGVAFGLYTLCIIILGDRFDAATLAGANAALVTMYEIGGVCGPVLVGHAIDQLGPDGMPIVLVLSGVPVVLYYGYRRISKMKKEKQYGA